MKNFLLYAVIAAFGLFGGRCSCDDTISSAPESIGSVSAKVIVNRVGTTGKTRAINLKKAYLELSTDGEETLKDSFDLSGASQQTVGRIFADIRVKTWKARAWTIDENSVIIHLDSTTFSVVENDTINANLNLSSRFGMLVAKVYSISDSAKSGEIMVNGVMVADSVFGKNAPFDTLRLYFDYLPASPSPGTAATIRFNIRGDWIDPDTLLWTGEKVINVISGQDVNQAINLVWVGPQVGGVNVIVEIGPVGTYMVDGIVMPRPNTGL